MKPMFSLFLMLNVLLARQIFADTSPNLHAGSSVPTLSIVALINQGAGVFPRALINFTPNSQFSTPYVPLQGISYPCDMYGNFQDVQPLTFPCPCNAPFFYPDPVQYIYLDLGDSCGLNNSVNGQLHYDACFNHTGDCITDITFEIRCDGCEIENAEISVDVFPDPFNNYSYSLQHFDPNELTPYHTWVISITCNDPNNPDCNPANCICN